MTTHDISRHVLQPAKQYSGARMQKGRVILDSDFNEGELLDDEGQRVVVVDVVGRHGSSDRGFTIKHVTKATYELEVLAGSYYLGGLRHEIAGAQGPAASQLFSAQTDWLQSNRTGEQPAAPVIPGAARDDLVYLIGWEQGVSAREDGELFEPSLSGRDTSTRVRRMHRVYVKQSSTADCATAFGALVTGLTAGGHIHDPTSGELLSAGRLKVQFDAAPVPEDLCSGSLANGYKGAENQAIRVEMIAPSRFLWAFDNAAPLYRISASVTAGVVTITFITPPQEQAQFPLKGQVLEILPWGAQLQTGEHTADFRIADNIGGGVFARVTQSYNPRTKVLVASTLEEAKLANMLAWFPAEVVGESRYFYLRVWNSDNPPLTTSPYGLEFTSTTPVPLAGTGLKVHFTTPGIVGDHWVIAARPTTPEVVVPWELSKDVGAAPHGPRRFYAPLAIVHWTPVAGSGMKATVDSCRRTFRGLTRLGGCCSVTVGDGATSHGDYTSIQEAILALPPGEPGKVCVLPGVYEQIVHITGRKNVVVEGCGAQTILRTPAGNDKSRAVITLEGCLDFSLRKLRIEASGQFGVGITATSGTPTAFSARITLEELEVVTSRDRALPRARVSELAITDAATAFPLCTVAALGVYDLKVLRCKLTMIGDLSAAANMLLFACVRVVVRDTKIATPAADGRISKAWGGLQIAGYCNDILVEACEIAEGLGYGVTLGSVRPELTLGASTSIATASSNPGGITEGVDCPGLGGGFDLTAADSGEPVRLVPDPGPHDVRLRNNRIHGMGSSGISVLGFFPQEEGEPVPQIETHRLVIADNIIEKNYTHPSEQAPSTALRAVVAFGGVVLADADGLRIHDNRIEGNGVDHRRPVCGIYVLHGEDVVVENNRIRGNGPRVASSGLSGHRAGIALQLVGRRISVDGDGGGSGTVGGSLVKVEPETAQPAARVRGNVVLQPAGRALQIYGIGPMFVEGNVLVSEGLDGMYPGERRLAAHCVEIQNVGQSRELIDRGIIPANIQIFGEPQLLEDPLPTNIDLHDGRILFTDNQVRFNPVVGAGINVFCATRIQSYGEVAVLGNQFYARLAPGEGILLHDTILTAWSLRASHNRWEDPSYELSRGGPIATAVSAQTLAFMNITTLNQASRCIHVDVPVGHGISHNPIAINMIWNDSDCDPDPALNALLGDPTLVDVP